jgi:hypothetical protein
MVEAVPGSGGCYMTVTIGWSTAKIAACSWQAVVGQAATANSTITHQGKTFMSHIIARTICQHSILLLRPISVVTT